MRFATAESRAAFAEELAATVARLAAKYHDDRAPNGRRFRLLAAVHPAAEPNAVGVIPIGGTATMNKTTIDVPTRAFEMSLDLAASPDEVWRALTVAEELVRWFPVDAKVTPGAGGSMVWSWGDNWDWTTRIDAWDPGRLLRLVQEDARPYDAEGRPVAEGQAAPARIAIEFTLESHRGQTRLRLVHSGFGSGAAWDDEVEGITEGWQAELASLRHYLERHRGRNRQFRIAWLSTSLPRG